MATTIVEQRKTLAKLQADRGAVNATLAEAEAELATVTDERRAVELSGLKLARQNRVAQLDRQIGEAQAALAQAEEEDKKRRAAALLEQVRGIMRGHYADVRKIYAELEAEGLEALVREYGNLTHPVLQQRVDNDLATLRGNLVRVLDSGGYKIIRPMGVPPIVSAEPER